MDARVHVCRACASCATPRLSATTHRARRAHAPVDARQQLARVHSGPWRRSAAHSAGSGKSRANAKVGESGAHIGAIVELLNGSEPWA
jgi:hypothetical protein